MREVDRRLEITRLGEGVFSSGFLTPESMAETVATLSRLAEGDLDRLFRPFSRVRNLRTADIDRVRGFYVDLLGFGRSDKPAGPYDVRTLADDAVAVMDACGFPRAPARRPLR